MSRRDFFERAGAFASAAWIASVWPAVLSTAAYAREARRRGAGFNILTEEEAAALDAISAQIIPSGDDLPGAREAGVVHFMDRAFGTFMAPRLELIRGGLVEFENGVRAAHPEADSFASLADGVQTEMMALFVLSPLFQPIRFLTLTGMFADPSYGGNRDKAGWQLIGFEDRHVWQPPFGYYDAMEGEN